MMSLLPSILIIAVISLSEAFTPLVQVPDSLPAPVWPVLASKNPTVNINVNNNSISQQKRPTLSSRPSSKLYQVASSSNLFSGDDRVTSVNGDKPTTKMHPLKAKITKAGMMSFVASMCVALPATLYPVKLLHKARIINTLQKETISCRVGCFCSRWLVRLIPFANVNVMTEPPESESEPEPAIWVCNHTSMLDIFFLLAKDKKLRGENKRPIKIIYWKDLEKNPVTKLLFTMSGFIPVEMEDNGNGNANTYKKSSFKALLKNIKKAFEDGFE